MNNFIFENATKTYFGKGCVKEYLATELNRYGKKVFVALNIWEHYFLNKGVIEVEPLPLGW